jgi:hypothetical protein
MNDTPQRTLVSIAQSLALQGLVMLIVLRTVMGNAAIAKAIRLPVHNLA